MNRRTNNKIAELIMNSSLLYADLATRKNDVSKLITQKKNGGNYIETDYM